MSQTTLLDACPSWDLLKKLYDHSKAVTLNQWFDAEPSRTTAFQVSACGIHLDYSKNKVSQKILNTLFQCADERRLKLSIKALLEGGALNFTEKGPAHHTLYRDRDGFFSSDLKKIVLDSHQQMTHFVARFQDNELKGATGEALDTVVCLGVGGSYWGPLLVFDALVGLPALHKVHFVANACPVALDRVLAQINPASTLFIIASKSFSTTETLLNAEVATRWLKEKLHCVNVMAHFVAITSQPEKARAWGIGVNSIFELSPWLGGRYSLWSAMALPLVLKVGMEPFYALLDGAHAMDRHFSTAPWQQNMPVIMALLGLWYLNFSDASTYAIFPYPEQLQYLTPYVQQLTMESLGKSTTFDQQRLNIKTTPIIWGGLGILGQHSYYQALHQSQMLVPSDIVLIAEASHRTRFLNSSGLAQSIALMIGHTSEDPYRSVFGDQPSNIIILSQLRAFELGALLALYEHKVFVHASMLAINPFDQFGVDFGKKLAKQVNDNCHEGGAPRFDALSQNLRRLLALS